MTKLEQAARQALGALEVATTPLAKDRQEVLRAITTLREALSGVQALSAAPAEQQVAPKAAPGEREQAAQRLREFACVSENDVTDPFHPRYIEGYKKGHAAGRKRAAPQQEAQEPAFVDVSLRTAIAKAVYQQVRVEFDYKLGSWTALDADEQQRIVDSIRGLYTAPQPAPAPLSEREAFEAAWEKLHGKRPVLCDTAFKEAKMDVPAHSAGKYFYRDAQAAWKAWQARAALAAQGDKR